MWRQTGTERHRHTVFVLWRCVCGKIACTGGNPPSPCVCQAKR